MKPLLLGKFMLARSRLEYNKARSCRDLDFHNLLIYNQIILLIWARLMADLQQLRKGTTTLLILSILSTDSMYGYQIMRELERRSEGYFTMTAALLYPALHQLEMDGLLVSEWQAGQGTRRRKYYSLTAKGKKALLADQAVWTTFMTNLRKTLAATGS